MVDITATEFQENLTGVRSLRGWLATLVLARGTAEVLHCEVAPGTDVPRLVERVVQILRAAEEGAVPADGAADLLGVHVRWERTALIFRLVDRDTLAVALVDRRENPHGLALAAFRLSRLGEVAELL